MDITGYHIDSLVVVAFLYLIWLRLGEITKILRKEEDRRYSERLESELRKRPALQSLISNTRK
jgi:hypothetical protein